MLDSAGQKGTGRHTAQSALELGAPVIDQVIPDVLLDVVDVRNRGAVLRKLHGAGLAAPQIGVQLPVRESLDDSVLNYPDYLVFDIDPYIYSGKEAKGAEPELSAPLDVR